MDDGTGASVIDGKRRSRWRLFASGVLQGAVAFLVAGVTTRGIDGPWASSP